MLKGANSNEVIKNVTARITEIQKSLPEGIRIVPFLDRSELIAETTGPELNELFHYYQSFRKGSPDLLMRDALESLIPLRVLRARLGAEEAGMRVRMDEALAALQGGMEFAEVVARYSEDDDEDAPLDGQYTFARAVATQPFDRLSHTMPLDELSAPFWTKYGLHVLQVTDYERGEQPDGDQTHVRHILIMWPTLRTLDQEGKDIRKVIHGWVAESQIRVMELAVGNMLPPQNRNESASGS